MTVIDPAFEFDCPKYRNFAVADDELVSDDWFEQQRVKLVLAKETSTKARKSTAGPANKENAAANAPVRRASVSSAKRKSIKPKVEEERAPLASRVSTKPIQSTQPLAARPSLKPRPSVSSQKSAAAALSKPRVSVSATPRSTSAAPTRLSTRPSTTAGPPTSRASTAARISTQPQHRRSISTPVQPAEKQPQQSASHKRSRSSVQHQSINQPSVRLSTRPSATVIVPSAVATTVRSTAPLTRPTAINFATDSRALERAAKEKQRVAVQPKSASAPSTARVPLSTTTNTTQSQQSKQRSITRCEPFKLSTNERKRKPAPVAAPATPMRVNPSTKRPRPTTTQSHIKPAAPTPVKAQPVHRPLTSPSPFALQSVTRHEAYQAHFAQQLEAERLAEIEAKKFRAPPLEAVRHVLTASPFVPKLEHCYTEPDNVSLNCDTRATARRAWEEMQRAHEEEQAEIERKRTVERARSAAAELAALRNSLVHHPLQVPNFQHVFHPHPSSQPLTEARSPCLLTKSRAMVHLENHN